MEQYNYNSRVLIKNMPSAFAHHKVIFAEYSKPLANWYEAQAYR